MWGGMWLEFSHHEGALGSGKVLLDQSAGDLAITDRKPGGWGDGLVGNVLAARKLEDPSSYLQNPCAA